MKLKIKSYLDFSFMQVMTVATAAIARIPTVTPMPMYSGVLLAGELVTCSSVVWIVIVVAIIGVIMLVISKPRKNRA